ncbi:MAG: dihydroorotate dehydrogenase electron transfer subunit [bacterium]|nr:dihydroorotate dehydrogenase electron transfer subunit [bacterium]
MISIKAQIIDKKLYGSAGALFRLIAPDIATEAQPGQFALIRCGESYDPLLRRPLTFFRLDKKQGTLDILFRILGKGTALLAEKNIGDTCDILGPLGKGFQFDKTVTYPVLLAGGMGVAPLFALAEQLVNINLKPLIFLGAKTQSELWYKENFMELGCEINVATDDGSFGFKGTVLDLFNSEIAYVQSATVFGCGPMPMLKRLAELAHERKFQCQISLEENMACGLGACQGCVVPVVGPEKYKLVCKDGPVFNANEISFVFNK